jgi:predicted PurR-regulated permease PerM
MPEEPTELLAEGTRRALAFLAPRAGALVADVLGTLGNLVAILFALFFMLRDGEAMARHVRDRLAYSTRSRADLGIRMHFPNRRCGIS